MLSELAFIYIFITIPLVKINTPFETLINGIKLCTPFLYCENV